jgi:hypothetical protein
MRLAKAVRVAAITSQDVTAKEKPRRFYTLRGYR